MSNFLSLVQDLASEIGYTAPSTVVSQTGSSYKLVRWIREADKSIQRLWLDWRFMRSDYLDGAAYTQAITAGTQNYDAPTSPYEVETWDAKSFFIGKGSAEAIHLAELDYDLFDRTINASGQISGTPGSIIITPANDLILDPIPIANGTLTALFYAKPFGMSGNNDIPITPDDRLIIVAAKQMYALESDAPEVLEGANYEYEHLLKSLESKYLPRQKRTGQSSAQDPIVVRAV